MKKVIVLMIVVAGLGAAGYQQWQVRKVPQTAFNFSEVKRGHLEATVGSTGTLQPRELVDVGAQVLGRIIFIGKDPNTASGMVDWGSEVQGPVLDSNGKIAKRGTILAQIDPSLYEAQRNSTRASVNAAKADVGVKTAALDQATRNFGRAEKLIGKAGISQAEYDQFKAAFDSAKASLELSKANVGLAEASLNSAQTNLDYTTISAAGERRGDRSPRQRRPDRRGEPLGPEPLPHRQGLEPDGSLGDGQRGGRRQDPRRPGCPIHRGCLPGPAIPRCGRFPGEAALPPQRHDEPERGDLYGGGQRGQQGRAAPPLLDGQLDVCRGGQERCAHGAQCRPALATDRRPDCRRTSGRPTSSSGEESARRPTRRPRATVSSGCRARMATCGTSTCKPA